MSQEELNLDPFLTMEVLYPELRWLRNRKDLIFFFLPFYFYLNTFIEFYFSILKFHFAKTSEHSFKFFERETDSDPRPLTG